MTEVSFWPIFISGFVSVFTGFIWYHPSVFGTAWMRLSNITPEMAEKGKRRMPISIFVSFLASMIVAYVMSYFAIAWGVFDWIGAIELGFWCWIGFTAPTMLGQVLWEQRPVRVYLIHVFHWLVTMILIAVVVVIGSQLVFGSNTISGNQPNYQSE